ncbi:MAG: nucleotidyltransferase domain-containing protein [Ignisphaera sp.]|nr:nucleotidyltransferase domain-containing protein [Ignisphaera sp.]MCC6055711.1 nucleotidyltransferase domain-containing protein [Desulfurococcaceae archaeon]
MAKVIEERVREREEAVRGAREFAVCVSQKLGKVTAILFGSFARGDFNVWSDIDVLIVAENLPQKPLERLSTIDVCLSRFPRVEPILITIEEFVKMKKKSVAVIEAVERGIVLLDMLNLISTA